jgi:hypothetical protein
MNKQIRLIAALSGYRPERNFEHFDIERFAELIVRECAGVCESMQLIGPYKEVQDATLKDAVVQIKEHFGVEE